MAAPSLTYTLTNGTTADASQVMQNFNDLLNGITDGTKDLSISALTCAGTATLNGHVNLGNSSSDDLTITASLAASLPIKTDASYDIGSSTKGLRVAYFGGNSQRVGIKASGSTSATWDLTLPVSAGTDKMILQTNGSGVSSWVAIGTITSASLSNVGLTSTNPANAGGITLNKGKYVITAKSMLTWSSAPTLTSFSVSISTSSGTANGPSQVRELSSVTSADHYVGTSRILNVTSDNTDVYMVVVAVFTGGTSITTNAANSQFEAIQIGYTA